MKNLGKKFLSDLKLYSDYFKWKEELGRYENWDEAQESIIDGHRKKYSQVDIENYLEKALSAQKEQLVLASQRNLQYRHDQLMSHNARMYNCCGSLLYRNDYFQKYFYILLCGTGLDFSVRRQFIDQLSPIGKRTKGTKTHVVEDSIEGWADALGVLLSSYFLDNQPFPEYAGYEIRFDYSQIRPKGAYISGGFKAPGPDGLKSSLEKIETMLDKWIEKEGSKIRPILAYDIVMHAADAVLSGGVRRSACSILIDEGDEETINAKIGNWRQENPQRARSNNAIGLIRKSFSKERLEEIIALNNGDNDISFIFVNDEYEISNPCFSGDMKILTAEGYKTFEEIGENRVDIVDGASEIKPAKISISGIKKLVEVQFRNRTSIKCTPQHVFLTTDNGELEAQDLKGKQIFPYLRKNFDYDKEYIKYGFLQGDGCLGRLISDSHKGLEINLSLKDKEIRDLFQIESQDSMKEYINGYNEILNELGFNSNPLPERTLPTSFNSWGTKEKVSFLRGLWSANGSFIKAGRVAFKSTCKELIDQLQEVLKEFDISSYITTNKTKPVKFKNGEYLCKESYDLNICKYTELLKFYNTIGFEQEYKTNGLREHLIKKAPVVTRVKELQGLHKVYDFSVEDTILPWGIVEDVVAHNCREITFRPVLEDGTISIQFCNLNEINAEKCKTEEIFLRACEAASILGTLQAGYTSFPYLGEDCERLVAREALLGVSITGWMNNPKLFNAELLKKGANKVKEVNKELASEIGINPAARLTTCKPAGNSSVILGTASGIHPEHSRRYFRIMQLNKEAATAKWLEDNAPFLMEESVWSANNTDYVVYVPIENPKEGLYKKDMKGVKHLELIKLVQENWVNEGTNVDLCLKPWLRHSTSCTVIIDDIQKITDYIYEHEDSFKAVSFLSDYGDKDFNQAPFTSVLNMEELVAEYGKGAVLASGLVVDGLHYFDQNLWQACDSVLDKSIPVTGTREQVMLKKYWITRAKKFAKNYFKNDLKKMVYCLKDIHLFHKWETVTRQFKEVDFGKILDKPQYKDISDYASMACSGGSCEITHI